MILDTNFFFGKLSFWAIGGCIYLLILSWQDVKNKMVVDQRLNYLMMGVTFALISHINRPLWYLLVALFISLILQWFINKYQLLGNGDALAISWIFYGFGIIGPDALILFLVGLTFVKLLYLIVMRLFSISKAPFFPGLFAVFFLVCLILKLY